MAQAQHTFPAIYEGHPALTHKPTAHMHIVPVGLDTSTTSAHTRCRTHHQVADTNTPAALTLIAVYSSLFLMYCVCCRQKSRSLLKALAQ